MADANKAVHEPVGIEIVIDAIKVWVPGCADTRDIEAVPPGPIISTAILAG